MNNEKAAVLSEQIERTAAERRFLMERMLSEEGQIRFVGLYYAVLSAAAALLSLIYPNLSFQALSVMMTVMLSMLMVILAVQKYGVRAQRIRCELAELEKLAAEAQDEEKADAVRMRLISMEASFEAVGSHDARAIFRLHDREDVHRAAVSGKTAGVLRLYGYEKFLYWFAEITGIVLKALILLLPVAAIVLTACGVI